MKLTDIVNRKAIIARLQAASRDDVIVEMIDSLIAADAVSEDLRQDLIDAVIAREKKGSTGFGKGVAVPHVKHKAIGKMTAAIGVSEDGVDFNALDREPVYSIFLLLSPEDQPEDHLLAMEVIFKNLSQPKFRSFLRQAATVEDISTLLDDADNQTLGG
ncbi:MAG: PTS sugar transporter subunit IIA [Phycisphaerales bacterium]